MLASVSALRERRSRLQVDAVGNVEGDDLAGRVHAGVGAAGGGDAHRRAASATASARSISPCTVGCPGWSCQPAHVGAEVFDCSANAHGGNRAGTGEAPGLPVPGLQGPTLAAAAVESPRMPRAAVLEAVERIHEGERAGHHDVGVGAVAAHADAVLAHEAAHVADRVGAAGDALDLVALELGVEAGGAP